ncbi:MAG: hypothetical protein WD512_12855 [Candidatus Paceibacterota bacterium]
MKTFELSPINGRKSFGGKCKVIEKDGVSKLQSYDTVVAEYNHKENKMIVNGWYSKTTSSHINSFLDYYGFDTCTKKELETYNK